MIDFNRWECGDGCCSETSANVTINDNYKCVVNKTLHYNYYAVDSEYNEKEDILEHLNKLFNVEMTIENTKFE